MPCRQPEAESGTAGMVSARAAREAVAAMRQALLGSAAAGCDLATIENLLPGLEQAVIVMQELMRQLTLEPIPEMRDGARLRRELAALRDDLTVATRLAGNGAEFCLGLARLLGAASGGYTPGGEGAPLRPAGGLLVRG
jgi:hypothetical protein